MTDKDVKSVTIKGRDIAVKPLTEGQYMLMGREMTRVKRVIRDQQVAQEDVSSLIRSMAYVLDIIETRVINEDDRDYLTDLMAAGELDFADLLPVVSVFTEEEDAKPATVTRGRTSRTKR